MATEKQIEANRRNALQSTGPRTEAGKAVSRRNALWHGLSAKNILLDNEDPQNFEMLRQSLHDQYQPGDAVEEFLVENLAQTMWRLARAPSFEAAILDFTKYAQLLHHDPSPWGASNRSKGRYEIAEYDQPKLLGRAVKEMFSFDIMSKLSRHETHLMRQVEHTLDRLHSLQKERGVPTRKNLDDVQKPADITIDWSAVITWLAPVFEEWAKSKTATLQDGLNNTELKGPR